MTARDADPSETDASGEAVADGPAGASRERLFLLDGTALAYRAHFAFLKAGLKDRQGRPTGAVHGFVATLFKLLDDERPDHVGVAFDPPGPTFRHERYAEYKATRERMDDDLVEQLPRIREVVRAFRIPVLEVPGFEADDVMGTIARAASERGIDVHIVTGDKDLCQVVRDARDGRGAVKIHNILKPGQDVVVLDEAGVHGAWGVPPARIVDVLALMGDTSDNVPGVPGVGEKTAVSLVNEFGGVADVLAAAEREPSPVTKAKVRENLRAHRALAELSLSLVQIDEHVPVDVRFEDLALSSRDDRRLAELFRELNFTAHLARVSHAEAATSDHEYRIVRTPAELRALAADLAAAPLFAVDTETTDLDARRARVVGISFSWADTRAVYVPLNLVPPLFASEGVTGADEDRERILAVLAPVLEDPARPKAGQNAKYDITAFRREGVTVRGYAIDTMIASFCLDPEAHQHNLDALALRHFGYRKIATKEILGSGRTQVTMADVPVEKVGEYACEDADFTFRLARTFLPRLEKDGTARLFREVELPLVAVLADMEWEGVRVDTAFLEAMTTRLAERTSVLEREVCEAAGQAFNLQSPKQLGEILFEKLKIQGSRRIRRTKTGWSTDEQTLSEFADHAVVGKLLEHRRLAKLRSTYTEALVKLVNPDTGHVHTSYSQTGAITGRLASSDPNLQNIPIRTPEGREIRRAFVARADGWELLSADYSQIELRILAHLSADEALCEAFHAGEDIHRRTAARVFGMSPALVTPELRSRAKAINFGILYGMGANRLAQETSLSRKEAQDFIDAYFRAYPAVAAWLDDVRRTARETGEVRTLLGRRRSLRELYESPEPRIQAQADNVAVNTPVQGSAADIVKIAMIRIHRELRAAGLASRMILQVHDELVFDVAPGESETVQRIVRTGMEGAVTMRVPLLVEMGHGRDWYAAH